MNGNWKIVYTSVLIIALIFNAEIILTESIDNIDRRAQEYYEQKEFTKAITEWLRILELDPENEMIQRKIEYVYEEKHRKDLALVWARKYYRVARNALYTDYWKAKENAEKAIENFVISYRIDPKDPEVQDLRERMRILNEDIINEGRRIRLTRGLQEKYNRLVKLAQEKMEVEEFEEALKYWIECLSILPKSEVALEGKRKAELAINNRLKYEKIKKLLALGIGMFNEKRYADSKLEFKEVLRIDPGNDEAEDYIDKIDDILEETKNIELKRFQAEQFYVSGINNIRKNNFDGAEDDFENVLALIADYKDAKARLASIPALRKEYQRQMARLRLKGIDEKFQGGLIALNAGRYNEAISYFEETIKLDPDNKLAREYMKTAKEALKQRQEEIVDENSPYYNVINPLIMSGRILYEKGKFAESRERWVRILNVFPKNRIATEYLLRCDLMLNPKSYERFSREIVDRGKQLLKENKYKFALSQFQLIKSISPNYADIDALIEKAKQGSTVAKSTELKGASPAELDRRYRLGMIAYSRGGKANLEEALGHFRWVVARDKGNLKAVIALNRIEAQLRIGTGTEVAATKRLTDKQRRLVRIYYFNGINYYSNNKFEKAIAEWRKVLLIDPLHQRARNNIQRVLALMKR
jgi:tetratricopeptide (TPR) repeat protein